MKQQAAPLPAPLLQGPPPKAQAAPVPPAPQVAHRPAGKRYNPPRGPPPKAANIIDVPHEDELRGLFGPNLVDITVGSGILQLATNIDKKEKQLQEDLIKQTIELQDFYDDDLSQYTQDDIKAAIASELHSLGKKKVFGEADIDSLTPEQQHRVIKTRWVIGPRPSSTSVDDMDITTGPLKAGFVARGYSQYISDNVKETFAATPSSTSLRRLLLHAVLHLHSTLRELQLQQLKSDRCVQAKPHGSGLRRRLAHRRNIKGDIIVSGTTSTIIQLETLYCSYNTTTTSHSRKAHLQTSER